MIYIFKTSVKTEKDIKKLKPKLDHLASNIKWNFDLEDCDNILRIANCEILEDRVVNLLKDYNFECKELD
ncbi:hypothetical protein [Flavivirga spongiicola]|uniref:Uncharacterized protein n=1 Tax=Flavivirga spongiicola TaxID=421621 RepID=A0ABU7XMY2_9FLAO|nr:hypothetical protein [Flavivirga sp. MEBiC05379]MDO5981585.1 hypothetical protein [Flavivirga sp. MEBiC05379]